MINGANCALSRDAHAPDTLQWLWEGSLHCTAGADAQVSSPSIVHGYRANSGNLSIVML